MVSLLINISCLKLTESFVDFSIVSDIKNQLKIANAIMWPIFAPCGYKLIFVFCNMWNFVSLLGKFGTIKFFVLTIK